MNKDLLEYLIFNEYYGITQNLEKTVDNMINELKEIKEAYKKETISHGARERSLEENIIYLLGLYKSQNVHHDLKHIMTDLMEGREGSLEELVWGRIWTR